MPRADSSAATSARVALRAGAQLAARATSVPATAATATSPGAMCTAIRSPVTRSVNEPRPMRTG